MSGGTGGEYAQGGRGGFTLGIYILDCDNITFERCPYSKDCIGSSL